MEHVPDEDVAKVFLGDVPARNQFPLKALEASNSITFGYYTTQLVESMNKSLKPCRTLSFVPAMIELLVKERNRYNEHKGKLQKAINEGYNLTPAAHDILKQIRREAENLAPNVTEGELGESKPLMGHTR